MTAVAHPFLSGLLGDAAVAGLLSAEADIDAMIAFEAALAEAQGKEGILSPEAAAAIAAALETFRADMEALREATARDGVVVPELVRQARTAVGEPYGRFLHHGATSQDVIDTSFAIRAKAVLEQLDRRLEEVIEALRRLASRCGSRTVMAHTRMQAARPVSAGRKIESWLAPLERHRARMPAILEDVAILHLGGPVGTLDAFGTKGEAVAKRMAERLGLGVSNGVRHSERDGIAVLAGWLSLVTGSLGKMGADIALAAQQEVGEIVLASGGGSSSMAHKVNPVGAEVLVALARFNATLVSGVHQALVHENERSGAAWTLEWMIVPQMLVATAAALRTAADLVGSIEYAERGQGT